jgi:lantibiotic modifying enzyme
MPDRSGLDWGNGGTFGGLWCYGASGVGLIFLRLLHLGKYEGALEIAHRAGRSAALAGRYASPGLCHGLGGSIEYLLDLHHQTGKREWLDQARELHQLLDTYRQPRTVGVGYPTTPEDDSDTSYMLGDAGTIGTLLRLATDVHTPRLLSTDAIRSLRDPGLQQ